MENNNIGSTAVGPASVDLASKESQLYMAYFMAPKKEEKKNISYTG